MSLSIFKKTIIFGILTFFMLTVNAQQTKIENLNVYEGENRVYINFNAASIIKFDTVTYNVLDVEYPFKKIVDIRNVELTGNITEIPVKIYPVEKIRLNRWFEDLRMVFDLNEDTGMEIYQDSSLVSIELYKKEKKIIPEERVVKKEKEEAKKKEKEKKENLLDRINFRDESIKTVLRAFSKFYNLNIVVSKDVKDDRINVRLESVPVEGALDAILKANGYSYFKKDNIYIVKGKDTKIPGEMTTEIFKLEYIDANDLQEVLEDIKSEEGKINIFKRSPIGEVGVELPQRQTSGGVGGTQTQVGAMAQPQVTTPTATTQRGGTGGGGAASGEGRSDIIMVTDYSYIIENIRNIIKELDVKVPQIQISVKFVETTLDEKEKWGINWNIALEAVGKGGQAAGQMAGGMLGAGVGGVSPTAATTAGTQAGGAAGGAVAQVQGLPLKINSFQFGTLSFSQLKIMLDLLEQRGDSKLLNQPSITTLDNQQADIAIGTLLKIETTQMGMGMGGMPGQTGGMAAGGMAAGGMAGMAGMGGGIVTKTYQDEYVSIRLTVIPHVNEDKYITLWLKPVVQEITGFTGERSDIPIISDRTANTSIRVKDGDSVVIGGLIKEDKIKTTRRVKFLSSIPLLGALFRHTSVDSKRSELIIFITPTILKEDNTGD